MKVINNKWRSWSRDEVGSFFFFHISVFLLQPACCWKIKLHSLLGDGLISAHRCLLCCTWYLTVPQFSLEQLFKSIRHTTCGYSVINRVTSYPLPWAFFFSSFFFKGTCVLFKSRVTNYQKNDWQSYDCFNFAKSVYVLRRRDISWGWTGLYFCVILICTTRWCSESR